MDRCETRRIYESGGKYFKIWSMGAGGEFIERYCGVQKYRARACERKREGCGREHVQREERLEN